MKVFVYGTLKPGEVNYPYYCADYVSEALEAYTYGKLFHLRYCGYPAMTVGGEQVKGVLLTFNDDSVLIKLDELEGYNPGGLGADNEYYRQKIAVYAFSGEFLANAWGYLMMPEKVKQLGGVVIASGWWTQQHP
ncbi:gamma-glutamylcyclotransferase family protein [Gloeothece verrucosa]|uniref:AIG2 family protein n=1 Tax=Gloeothece verrucosa (strain PCC 7822) TaxID=497965 RepID=E0U8X0_GLOV7|nr:gamma-glutamylcyclotransferase family protein [Gloeothece verrucosa]ADN16109.1 AIG2 family protein [Gloeothece verrucosa PCC 7822]